MRKLISFSLLILLFVVGCGKDSRSLRDEAKSLAMQQKGKEALALFEQITREHPDSDEAPEALFASAGLYLNVQNDAHKAASAYELVCEKYPASEFGHKGLFAAGYTYANTIGNIERAREVYDRYLKQYPDSSMAETVRFELEHLGMSPEELLESLQESNDQSAPSASEN